MQVRKGVRESTVVYLLGVEGTLHSASSLSHISHEVITLLIVKLVEIVDMLVVSHEATSSVCLFLKEEET